MDLRVASNFASFSTSGAQALGCPTALHFQLCLSMSRQVAPASASSGLAGDGSSSRLESRILQRIQRLSSELPRSFAPPVAPVDESPGLPRFLHLPAVPATDIRVAPNLASFSASGAGALGFPSAPLFHLRFPVLVASFPAPSTFRLCLGSKFSGCPEHSFLWRRLMVSRVASVPASSGFAVPASSSCPESCIYGLVNDDFPVILELCILGLPADESSWPIGRCIFLSYSGCTDNIIQA